MSDQADLAQTLIEVTAAIQMRRREPGGPAATGECLFCGAGLPDGRRWCDADCRDGWAREQMLRSRHG
jgi:hypothetical protein